MAERLGRIRLRVAPDFELALDEVDDPVVVETVAQKTELDFVFRDVDGVKGVRRFILVPLDDSPALVTDVALPPRLRPDPKDRNRRIITPLARFPGVPDRLRERSL